MTEQDKDEQIARLTMLCEIFFRDGQEWYAKYQNAVVDLTRGQQKQATATAAAKPKRGRPRKTIAPTGEPKQE